MNCSSVTNSEVLPLLLMIFSRFFLLRPAVKNIKGVTQVYYLTEIAEVKVVTEVHCLIQPQSYSQYVLQPRSRCRFTAL